MDPGTFDSFRRLVHEASGIALGPGKRSLVECRIARRIRELGLPDESSYLDAVRGDPSGAEVVRLLDLVSTNVTRFFRDPEQFELLARVLTKRLAEGARRIRLWSAACATGEEPWSLAITVEEIAEAANADVRILATDLSTEALEHSIAGVYPAASMEGLDAARRRRWFEARAGGTSEIRGRLRERVLFRRLNLSRPPFPIHGPLDAIFCRNVMIYFDRPLRERLAGEFRRLLGPEGLLFLGSAETLPGVGGDFRRLAPSVYALVEGAP